MGYISVGFSHGCYAAVPVYLFPIWKEDPGPFENGDGGLKEEGPPIYHEIGDTVKRGFDFNGIVLFLSLTRAMF